MVDANAGSHICQSLLVKQRCIRLRRYHDGAFSELYHEHIPKHRLSDDSLGWMMLALVRRFEEASAEVIVRSCLNSRKGAPYTQRIVFVVEYPEPGVIRHNCGGDVFGWVDTVIDQRTFRRTGH